MSFLKALEAELDRRRDTPEECLYDYNGYGGFNQGALWAKSYLDNENLEQAVLMKLVNERNKRFKSDNQKLIEVIEKFLNHEDIVSPAYGGAVVADFEDEVELARKVLKEVR